MPIVKEPVSLNLCCSLLARDLHPCMSSKIGGVIPEFPDLGTCQNKMGGQLPRMDIREVVHTKYH